MTQPADNSVRALRRELAGAAEKKIAQIVAMVDALPLRGEADGLIVPLRPRLAQMRLPRPISLGRLLFTPVQSALVDGPSWRRGSPGVPRTACQAVIALVRAGLAEEASLLDRRLSGQTTANAPLMLAVGRSLWPRAATLLRDVRLPPGWQAQTGLTDLDFTAIVSAIRLILIQAPWVQEAAASTAVRPFNSVEVATRLADVVAANPAAEPIVAGFFIVLLAALPDADARIDIIENCMEASARPVIRRARALAMSFSLDRLDSGSSLRGNLLSAAGSIRRDAELLDQFTEQARQDPVRRARVQEVRRNLDEQCRARFEAALESDLMLPPPGAGPGEAVSDAAMMELEQAARSLHRFEQAARKIGGREFYDHVLNAVAAQLARAESSGLTGIDRVRLTELLLGADTALLLLKQVG